MEHWKEHGEDRGVVSAPAEHARAAVQDAARAFEATIRRRDRREIAAAALVCGFFAFFLTDPSWLTRAGAALVVAGCITTYWQLRHARRAKHAPVAGDAAGAVLRVERARVAARIRLLDRAVWWYAALMAVGVVLVVAGRAGMSWFTLIYAIIVLAGTIGIRQLNRAAVRRDLVPRHAELTRLLESLEE